MNASGFFGLCVAIFILGMMTDDYFDKQERRALISLMLESKDGKDKAVNYCVISAVWSGYGPKDKKFEHCIKEYKQGRLVEWDV